MASQNEELQTQLKSIETNGYVVLPNLLSKQQISSIKAALSPWLQQDLMGRNNFEGTRTERVYALLAKAPEIAALVEHPEVLALADAFLAPTYLLSANLAINIHPGETRQPFHADHASIPNCNRTETNGLSTIWAFDNFTSENGATEIIPGSHRFKTEDSTAPYEQVLMKAGSVLVFHGSLIHRGGANHSNATRMAITPQYCQPWLRQLENMTLAVPPETAKTYSSRLQALLGYSIRDPGFMGYVDGMHPKRLFDTDYQGRHDRGIPS